MTAGTVDLPWSEGATNRGLKVYRQWGGGDASAAEKASGVFLPHPYSTLNQRINSPKIKWMNRLNDPNTYHEGYVQDLFGVIPRPSDPWTSNHWNALVSELYADVKGGDFNASVASAQLGQTLGGMANAATRIYRAYRSALKGHLRDAAVALTGANKNHLSNNAATKEMASNWLQLQYGWLPLLGDVHSGTELLANYLHLPITRVVRARKQVSTSSSFSHDYWHWGGCKLRHRCQIIAILTEDVTGYQTLGLTDPFSVAWELVPYSFVLDWFLPIGPWLEAATAARTLKGTFVVTHTKLVEGQGIYSGSIYTIVGGDAYLYRSINVQRTIDSTLSTRIPAFKPLANVASLYHCLNALALLENLRR